MAFKLKYKNVYTSGVTSPIKAADMNLIGGAATAYGDTHTKVGDSFAGPNSGEEAGGGVEGDCYEQELTGEALAKCLEHDQKTTDPCDGKKGEELTKCRDEQISGARAEQAEIDKKKEREEHEAWLKKDYRGPDGKGKKSGITNQQMLENTIFGGIGLGL